MNVEDINKPKIYHVNNQKVEAEQGIKFRADSSDGQIQSDQITKQLNEESKEYKIAEAKAFAGSWGQTTLTIEMLCGSRLDINCLMDELKVQIRELVDDGSRQSAIMLASSSIALNVLSHNLLRNSSKAVSVEEGLARADLALKSFDQVRKMLLALDQIKRPRQQITQNNYLQESVQTNILDPQNEKVGSTLKGVNDEAT